MNFKFLSLILFLALSFSCKQLVDNTVITGADLIEPSRSATNINRLPTLRWKASISSEENISYDVYLDKESDPKTIIAKDVKETFFSIQDERLDASTRYYWKIKSKIDSGKTVFSETFGFITGEPITTSTSINFNRREIELPQEDITTIRYQIIPTNTTNKSIIWSTSNTNIASVSSTGVVTGISPGTTTIKAEMVDSSVQATILVKIASNAIPVLSIRLDRDFAELQIDEQLTLAALITPDNATNKNVIWGTNNAAVATVSQSGVVTAKGAGIANISATTLDEGKIAAATITISGNDITPTEITLNRTNVSLPINSFTTLVAKVIPDNATNKNVNWTSSNENIATINSAGVVTSVSEGRTIITATTQQGGFVATSTIDVSSTIIPTTSISLSNSSVNLHVDKITAVIPTIQPDNATNKNVIWSSDNTSVATVNSRGTILGISEGTATITAKTEDGNNTALLTVNVQIPPTQITVTPKTVTINIGITTFISAIITPANATDSTVIWKSNNTDVATVDSNGAITGVIGVSSGTAIITAQTSNPIVSETIQVNVSSQEYIFAYNGNTYYIINDSKSWNDAVQAAIAKSGYLIEINDLAEQNEIQRQIQLSNFTFTKRSQEVDNKLYIWIGATDQETATTWVWDGNNDNESTEFGKGYAPNEPRWTPTNDAYHNWGTGNPSDNPDITQQLQPDNGAYAGVANEQHYGAIALEDWEYGSIYQWDDLKGDNKLPYIIEVE